MPAVHGRLLIQVAVEQYGFGRIARHLDKEEGRAACKPDHLQAQTGNRLAANPAGDEVNRLVQIAVRLPVRVVGRGLVGNGQVFRQGWDDTVLPGGFDKLPGFLGIHTRIVAGCRVRCQSGLAVRSPTR